MKTYLMGSFIRDLTDSGDANLVKQVMSHVFFNDGQFKNSDADDHRYKGIKDAWIRYISRGKTAYRVIYIKKGDEVFLYRAGQHAVEDNLKEPNFNDVIIPVKDTQVEYQQNNYIFDTGSLIKTYEQTLLGKIITSMMHKGHYEIYLISPFVTLELLSPRNSFGKFLDKAVEENTMVCLVTKPPEKKETMDFYKRLEERNIFVYFNEKLHSKLYIFNVNSQTLNEYTKDTKPAAILGSANLTNSGLCLDCIMHNDELCYLLPGDKFAEAKVYADKLIYRSIDYKTYQIKYWRDK